MLSLRSINLQIGRLSKSMTQGGKEMAGRWRGMLGRVDVLVDVRDVLDQSYSRPSQ